jgi:hypothetical protein
MAGLDDFKAQLKGGGARPNLFSVEVGWPSATTGNIVTSAFMIKAASLPASVIGPIEVPFRGRKLKIAGDRTFENWTITVINDNGMEVRNAFEEWMNLVNAHTENISYYGGGNNALSYMQNMVVHQLSRQENITKSYKIVNAFPVNIQAIDLSYDDVDKVEEFTVELAYQYWESNTTT